MAFDTDVDRLRHLPDLLGQLKRAYWWVRKTFFTKQPPENPAVLVDMSTDDAEALFGQHFFEPGWEMSYNYHNEVVNLRRVQHVPETGPTSLEWWQVHIRGYCHDRHPNGTCRELELVAHLEPEPIEHPDAHISGRFIDVARGNEVVVDLLERNDIAYETIGDWTSS